ncbi:MAG: PASTA domain-containing protein, partial [bacterium]|nr:PASTA domain-containing protein [bacterium]
PEFNRQLVEGSVRQIPVVPDLTNKRIDVARAIARHLGFKLLIEDEGDYVLSQKLVVESGQPTKQKLIVKLGGINSSTAAYVVVPDIVGMDLRSAVSKLAQYQLRAYIHGSGRVIAQNPKPGTKMRAGARCVIECNPMIEVGGI